MTRYLVTFANATEAAWFTRWREASCCVAMSAGEFDPILVDAAFAIDHATVIEQPPGVYLSPTATHEALDRHRVARALDAPGTKQTPRAELEEWLRLAFEQGYLMCSPTCAAWVCVESGSLRRQDENSPPCDCWVGKAKRAVGFEG